MWGFVALMLGAVAGCRGVAGRADGADGADGASEVPVIAVGIMEADSLTVVERDSLGRAVTMYRLGAGDVADSLIIEPTQPDGVLEVEDVTIGVGFHWQQREPQQFEGRLRVLDHDGRLTLINDIDLERYLESVISSEMSASAPDELLRAHAIISRSWLLSQLAREHHAVSRTETPGEVVAWYDRDDHELFDVCADDHCQRYQGVTRRTSPAVARAVRDTRGRVLTYNDTVCDARFSKCCGGVTEEFESCWEPVHHPYLVSVPDVLEGDTAAVCAHPSADVLAAVLNNYDQSTTDFYRWTVAYRADSLGRLFADRTGRDLGYIRRLVPLHRGPSGRITRLQVVGDRDSVIIGKELEIRRSLSRSHLYSSAFDVTVEGRGPQAVITLHGAGWGHGVGLCQIGAAVMATRGIAHTDILRHYYPGATLTQAYK